MSQLDALRWLERTIEEMRAHERKLMEASRVPKYKTDTHPATRAGEVAYTRILLETVREELER